MYFLFIYTHQLINPLGVIMVRNKKNTTQQSLYLTEEALAKLQAKYVQLIMEGNKKSMSEIVCDFIMKGE